MERSSSQHFDYERSTGAVLRREAMEALRTKQRTVYNERFDPTANHDDPVTVEQIDESVEEYLSANGIDESHPYYNTLRGSVRRMSYDRMCDSRWEYGKWENPDDPDSPLVNRGVNDLYRLQEQLLGERLDDDTPDELSASSDAPNDAESESREEDFDRLEQSVGKARELFAQASAKRQGKLFSFKSKQYEALKNDYYAKVQALGKRHLAEHADYDENDKNLVTITYLFDEQEQLRSLTTKLLEDTNTSKFIKNMNKGNILVRSAKWAGLGLGAGLVGSFMAGAVGVGIIAGGTVAATRFARGFATKDNGNRGMDNFYDTLDLDNYNIGEDGQTLPDEARMIAVSQKAKSDFDEATKFEQRKRRTAAAYGTALIGAGALLGYGIHQGLEWRAGHNLTAWDAAKDWWNGDTPVDTDTPPVKPDLDNDGRPDANDRDMDGDGVRNKFDFDPRDPDVTTDPDAPDVLRWVDFGANAHEVTTGEGWYQTFDELGIPENHWHNVLEASGPKLHEQGLAYFDSDAREWRISHEGKLPVTALRAIAKASRRDGFDLAA